MNQSLINLALALSAVELVHVIQESAAVRKKVEWLRLTLAGKKYKDLPFQVTSRAQSYAVSLGALVILGAIFYGIFSIFNIAAETAFKLIAVLLVAAYVATAVLLDKYHVEIGAVTNPLRKK